LKDLFALFGGSLLREEASRLGLEGFADDVMTANVLDGGDANPGADSRPAFNESLALETLQGVGDGHDAHAQFLSELTARDGTSEDEPAAEDAGADLGVGTF